jgi:uncharacterized protein (TIGR00730 family)
MYAATAVAVGRLLAEHHIRLVYGGGAVGLMGTLADAALDAGGEVIGVIPTGLFRKEIGHIGLTELIEVGSMHERKRTMFELSDAFVALPGGLGTLEELFEVATWGQLGIHDKPIATLDVLDFWSPLHAFLRHAAARGFMKRANLDLIAGVVELDRLLPTLRAYEVPYSDKWIGADET